MTLKPQKLSETALAISHTLSGGVGKVIKVTEDNKGEVFIVRLDRKGKERKMLTRMVRREHLVVHRR